MPLNFSSYMFIVYFFPHCWRFDCILHLALLTFCCLSIFRFGSVLTLSLVFFSSTTMPSPKFQLLSALPHWGICLSSHDSHVILSPAWFFELISLWTNTSFFVQSWSLNFTPSPVRVSFSAAASPSDADAVLVSSRQNDRRRRTAPQRAPKRPQEVLNAFCREHCHHFEVGHVPRWKWKLRLMAGWNMTKTYQMDGLLAIRRLLDQSSWINR